MDVFATPDPKEEKLGDEFEDMVKKSKEDMEGRLRVGGERRCGVERHGCLWMQFAIYNLFRGNLGQPQIFCK